MNLTDNIMEQSAEEQVPVLRIRPRFEIISCNTIQAIEAKTKDCANLADSKCKATVNQGFIKVFLPKTEQHYWSPQLTLSLEEDENGTLIRGLYGPRPAVWTMFVFFYAVIGVAILFIAIFGFSYISLGKSGIILWLLPVLVIVFFSLYLVSYFGQKLGHDQMIILHNFIEDCLDVKIVDNL